MQRTLVLHILRKAWLKLWINLHHSCSCPHSRCFYQCFHCHYHFQLRLQAWLYSQSALAPAPFSTPGLPVSWPQFITAATLISLTITRKWMTSVSFRSDTVTYNMIIGSSWDTMKYVFRGEAINISTGEGCLQNREASRSGARQAEGKQGRPGRV